MVFIVNLLSSQVFIMLILYLSIKIKHFKLGLNKYNLTTLMIITTFTNYQIDLYQTTLDYYEYYVDYFLKRDYFIMA